MAYDPFEYFPQSASFIGPPMPDPFTPVPVPTPRPMRQIDATVNPGNPSEAAVEASSVQADGSGGAPAPTGGGGDFSSKLVGALRGVKAPAPPDVVKPHTPALPRQTNIQTGEFLALLNSLTNPRTQAVARPTTLGGALGIGRY